VTFIGRCSTSCVTTRQQSRVDRRVGERDAGLRRLRRASVLVLAAAGALTAVFGELAANAFPGRSGKATARVAVRTPGSPQRTVATPPPLVSAGSAAQAAASAAQAPVQTQAPPVVVSGGT